MSNFCGSKNKIKFWAWQVYLGRLPTRDRLLNYNLSVPKNCVLCNAGMESHAKKKLIVSSPGPYISQRESCLILHSSSVLKVLIGFRQCRLLMHCLYLLPSLYYKRLSPWFGKNVTIWSSDKHNVQLLSKQLSIKLWEIVSPGKIPTLIFFIVILVVLCTPCNTLFYVCNEFSTR